MNIFSIIENINEHEILSKTFIPKRARKEIIQQTVMMYSQHVKATQIHSVNSTLVFAVVSKLISEDQ